MAKRPKEPKSQLKAKNPKVIKGGEFDKNYFKAISLEYELELLNRDLRDPEKLISKAKVFSPDINPGKLLKDVIKRREKIRGDLKKLESKKPVWKTASLDYEERGPAPMHIEKEHGVRFSAEMLAAILKETRRCPDMIIGQVAASDFRHYLWGKSEGQGGTGSTAFWPTNIPVTSAFITGDTYSGDWAGSTGALFWQKVDDCREVPWPLIDDPSMIWEAGVFQFTLPPPECNSKIYWGATGKVRQVTDNRFDADWGRFTSNWVLRVSWAGEDFPSSINSFTLFNDGLYECTSYPDDTITSDTEVWNLSYNVPAGVQSRIYLGCSFQTFALNGTVSTIPNGEGDYFDFEYGITYIIVPVE